MQETLIKYCKLLQDNESERLKAKQSFQIETKIVEQKEEELLQVEKELKLETLKKDNISKKLEYLKPYDEFLTRVISEHKDTYSNKTELILRHETLKRANESLERKREKGEKELAEWRETFNNMEKEKKDTLLKLSNEVASLQKKLEEKEGDRQKFETQLEGSKKNSFTETVLIGRIFMAVDNLKNRCHGFNSTLQKTKRQVGQAKKKEAVAGAAQAGLKETQTQTSLPVEATHGSQTNTVVGTVTKIENTDLNNDEEIKKAEDDKIFDVKQAHHNLTSVLEDMRNYREILKRLKEDKEAKKGK